MSSQDTATPSNNPPPDDCALMEAIARGEEAALAALYDRYAPACLATCIRILHDRAEAEDVLTEIFWGAVDQIRSL